MMAGGLGGLGGWNQTFGDILSGLGQSLLSSPSNNMFQNFPQALQGMQAKRKEQRSDEAMVAALISAGLPPDKAMALAANPTAAALVINQQNQAKQQAFREKAMTGLGGPLVPPGAGGGSIGPQSMAPSGAVPTVSLDGSPDIMTAAKAAIKNNESSGNYTAVGPEVGGDRAYGAYQVMGSNIPEWTKKHLGKALSVKEFVQSPEAQDKVFEGEFGGYLQKYGNIKDAASMWFSGRPMKQAGNASDGYMTVPQYVAKIEKFLGGQAPTQTAQAPAGEPAPVQVAAAGGKFPVPLPDRNIPAAPTGAPAGPNRTQAYAGQQAQQALRMMIAAGDDKPTMEAAKESFRHWSKYLTPTDAQRNLEAAGISPQSELGRDILSGGATINREKLKIEQGKLALEKEGFDFNRYKFDQEYRQRADEQLRTADTRNYDRYRLDELNRGTDPRDIKSFEKWSLQDGGAKAAKTIVQMGQEGRSKALTERFENILKEGDAAATDVGLVRQLRDMGGAVNDRTLPALRGWLAGYGVKLGDDIGVIEAYNAAINRLTPAQRQGLPGAASERDVQMFKGSLPTLLQTPQGRAIVLDTMEALAVHKQGRARIAEDALLDPDGDYRAASKRLREMEDPFQMFKAYQEATGDKAVAPSGAEIDALKDLPDGKYGRTEAGRWYKLENGKLRFIRKDE
jgi:hypothetical protein